MEYKGIELKEVTEPQIFDPPKKMVLAGNSKEMFTEAVKLDKELK